MRLNLNMTAEQFVFISSQEENRPDHQLIVCNACFCKPQICWNFTFYIDLLFFFMSGLVKSTWVGFCLLVLSPRDIDWTIYENDYLLEFIDTQTG